MEKLTDKGNKMSVKKCFACKESKQLSDYESDNRKYQLSADLKTCKVCKQCELEKALTDLSCCRYNYETNKFDVIKFDSEEDVRDYFRERYNITCDCTHTQACRICGSTKGLDGNFWETIKAK